MADVVVDGPLEGIDWEQAKADLAVDDFDNGRSATALRRSFEQSQHVAFAATAIAWWAWHDCCQTAFVTPISSTSGQPRRTVGVASPGR